METVFLDDGGGYWLIFCEEIDGVNVGNSDGARFGFQSGEYIIWSV